MKEIASVRGRLWPSTGKRLKIRVAKGEAKSLAALVDKMERETAKK